MTTVASENPVLDETEFEPPVKRGNYKVGQNYLKTSWQPIVKEEGENIQTSGEKVKK